jgi:hypothetical protein
MLVAYTDEQMLVVIYDDRRKFREHKHYPPQLAVPGGFSSDLWCLRGTRRTCVVLKNSFSPQAI